MTDTNKEVIENFIEESKEIENADQTAQDEFYERANRVLKTIEYEQNARHIFGKPPVWLIRAVCIIAIILCLLLPLYGVAMLSYTPMLIK